MTKYVKAYFYIDVDAQNEDEAFNKAEKYLDSLTDEQWIEIKDKISLEETVDADDSDLEEIDDSAEEDE